MIPLATTTKPRAARPSPSAASLKIQRFIATLAKAAKATRLHFGVPRSGGTAGTASDASAHPKMVSCLYEPRSSAVLEKQHHERRENRGDRAQSGEQGGREPEEPMPVARRVEIVGQRLRPESM